MEDKIEQLSKIKKMLDDGFITEAEFNTLKQDILGDVKSANLSSNNQIPNPELSFQQRAKQNDKLNKDTLNDEQNKTASLIDKKNIRNGKNRYVFIVLLILGLSLCGFLIYLLYVKASGPDESSFQVTPNSNPIPTNISTPIADSFNEKKPPIPQSDTLQENIISEQNNSNQNSNNNQTKKYSCYTVIKRYSSSQASKLSYFEPIELTINVNLSFKLKSFDFLNTILEAQQNETMNFGDFDEANYLQSSFVKEGKSGTLNFKQYDGVFIINTRNKPITISAKVNFIYTDNINSLYEVQLLLTGYTCSYILVCNPVSNDVITNNTEKIINEKGIQNKSDLKEIKIGSQIWADKNLNESYFRNGDPIPEAKTYEEWKKAGDEGSPAWCYYANDAENGKKYGKLYNWYAVIDQRGLIPYGWHVPSDLEWKQLVDFLGKENDGDLPRGGLRDEDGKFYGLKKRGSFWDSKHGTISLSEYTPYLSYNGGSYQDGYSVHCIKNNH